MGLYGHLSPIKTFVQVSFLHKILYQVKLLQSVSKISNATQRLDISLFSESCQRVLPFLASRAYSSSTEWGMATPYLWVVSFTWSLIAEMILSLLWRVIEIHHAKAFSSEIPWEVENYDNSIGLNDFITDRVIPCSLPYLQAISNFHSTVDFCIRRWPDLVMIYW